jgi:tripartite-type tricarboxylate transporter receptor subunit TctC
MEFNRRLITTGLALLLGAVAAPAWSQFPDRPVRMLVGAPPGGPTDIVARIVAEPMARNLGQTVLVENRAGAGGNIATQALATAAPDGYVLLMGSFANAVNPSMMKVPYDTRRDLVPLAQVTRVPLVVVAPRSAPFNSVAELIAEAKRRPGAFAIASGGVGTSSHLAAELFKRIAGIDMPVIHYKGGAPALQDIIADRVQLMFDNPQTSLPHVKSGTIKLLAVTTEARLSSLPAVPAMSETPGLAGFEVISWHGIFARAGTPPDTLLRLSRAVQAAMSSKEVRERFEQMEIVPVAGTPEEFGRFFGREMELWGKVVREANIKSD